MSKTNKQLHSVDTSSPGTTLQGQRQFLQQLKQINMSNKNNQLHPVEMVHDGKFNTYTGKIFNLLNPDADSIYIEDVAHSLAMQCRWGGHSRVFYSVAQHCVLATEFAFKSLTSSNLDKYKINYMLLAVLLHDGHEAYTGDVIKPLKVLLGDYEKIAKPIQDAVERRFNIKRTETVNKLIHLSDTAMMHAEFDFLYSGDEAPMLELMNWTPYYNSYGLSWTPEHAEKAFIGSFRHIINLIYESHE